MARNILIFADGTGNEGGLIFLVFRAHCPPEVQLGDFFGIGFACLNVLLPSVSLAPSALRYL
jgi:hypothetical protein